MTVRIFLFGESSQGETCSPLSIRSLVELYENLGEAPKESQGIDYAVQALLCNRECVFYRVQEEGFSLDDYFKGIHLLKKHGDKMKLSAVFLPGVGNKQIIEEVSHLCKKHRMLLILTEKDLYDYLTIA